MKCKLPAASLKNLIKSLQALNSLGLSNKEADVCCVLTVRKERLYIEGANMGAYLRRNTPVTVMREGACGVKLGDLSKLKFNSDVTLEYDTDKRQLRAVSSKSRFNLQADQTAFGVIEASRPTNGRISIQATVPIRILQEATSTVAIKPGLKEENLTIQFILTPTPEGGRLEVVGTEHYSLARYWRTDQDISVQAAMQFSLPSSSCSVLMKEVVSPQVGIGVELGPMLEGRQTISAVRFSSPDTEVYYPTIEAEFDDAEANNREIRSGRSDGSFIATRTDLREAISTVKVLHDSATTGKIYIRLSRDRVELMVKSDAAGASGNTIVPAASITLPDGSKPQIIQLKEQYFSEAIDLAPDVVPLRIESWDKKLLFVEATQIENGGTEILISQVLTPDQPAA
jgi:DNA polymerase III sliding clamp (beta) subunit (PCNA family)